MFSCRRLRGAFTLIELLAVIGITAILLALLLPAVMAARSRARGIQCMSNLRAIGQAIHGFEQSRGHLPRAYCGITSIAPPQQIYCLSPHTEILPWLGLETIYDQFNFQDQGLDFAGEFPSVGSNISLASVAISAFRCPEDSFRFASANSYRFCNGILPISGRDPGGAFWSYRPVTVAEISDGMSGTAFVSERLVGSPDVIDRERNTVEVSGETDYDRLENCLAGAFAGEVEDPWIGHLWFRGSVRQIGYYHLLSPNSSFRDCHHSLGMDGLYSARSLHSSGVFVLMGDGHVIFASDLIDIKVWRAFATIAGGETGGAEL